MRLHLRKIEVWTGPAFYELVGIVKEVEAKVKKTTRNSLAINGEMLLNAIHENEQ